MNNLYCYYKKPSNGMLEYQCNSTVSIFVKCLNILRKKFKEVKKIK